jgi:hypothetical protein
MSGWQHRERHRGGHARVDRVASLVEHARCRQRGEVVARTATA